VKVQSVNILQLLNSILLHLLIRQLFVLALSTQHELVHRHGYVIAALQKDVLHVMCSAEAVS
jgi:hypothetical protein